MVTTTGPIKEPWSWLDQFKYETEMARREALIAAKRRDAKVAAREDKVVLPEPRPQPFSALILSPRRPSEGPTSAQARSATQPPKPILPAALTDEEWAERQAAQAAERAEREAIEAEQREAERIREAKEARNRRDRERRRAKYDALPAQVRRHWRGRPPRGA